MSIPGLHGIELGLGNGMRRLWEGENTCLGVTLDKISASKPRWPCQKHLLSKLLLKNQELPLLCLGNCERSPNYFHRKLPNHFRINISSVLRFGYTKTILGLTDLSMHLSACKHLGKLATRECFFSNGLQDVCAKTVQPTAISWRYLSLLRCIYIYICTYQIVLLSLSLFWYHIYMYIIYSKPLSKLMFERSIA